MNRPDPDSLISAFFDGELDPEEKMTAEELLQNSASAREELEETEKLSELLQQLPVEPAPKDLVHSVIRQAERQTLIPAEESISPSQPFFNRRRVFTIGKSLLVTSAMLGLVMFLMQQSHGPMVDEQMVAHQDSVAESKKFEEAALVDNDGDGISDETNLSFAADRIRRRFDGELATEELPMPEGVALDASVVTTDPQPTSPTRMVDQPGSVRSTIPATTSVNSNFSRNTAGFGHVSNGSWPTSNAGMAHLGNTAGVNFGVLARNSNVTVENVVTFACDNGLGQSGKWELTATDLDGPELTPFKEDPSEAGSKDASIENKSVNEKEKNRSRSKVTVTRVDKAKLGDAVAGDIVMSLCSNGDTVVPVELTVVDVQKSAGQVNYLFAQNGIPLAADEKNLQYSVALSDKGVRLRRTKQQIENETEADAASGDGKSIPDNLSVLKTVTKDSSGNANDLNDGFYVLYVEAPAPNVIAALASLEQHEAVTNLSLKQNITAVETEAEQTQQFYTELEKNSEVVRQQYYDRNADYIVQDHYSGTLPNQGHVTQSLNGRNAQNRGVSQGKGSDQNMAGEPLGDSKLVKRSKPGRPKGKPEGESKAKNRAEEAGKSDVKEVEIAGADSSRTSTVERRYRLRGVTMWVRENARFLLPAGVNLSQPGEGAADAYAVPIAQQVAPSQLTVAFQMPVEFDDKLQKQLVREEFLYVRPYSKELRRPAQRSAAGVSANTEALGKKAADPQSAKKNKPAVIVDQNNQPVTSPVRLLIVMRGNPMAAAKQPMN